MKTKSFFKSALVYDDSTNLKGRKVIICAEETKTASIPVLSNEKPIDNTQIFKGDIDPYEPTIQGEAFVYKKNDILPLIPNYGFTPVSVHGTNHTFHINEDDRKRYVYLSYDTSNNILFVGASRALWKRDWVIVSGVKVTTEEEFDWLMRHLAHSGKNISDYLNII